MCSGLNNERLLDVVEIEQPDAVLLYLPNHDDKRILPMQLIQHYPGIKVVALDLESNEIEIYHRQKRCIHTIADLLSALDH